MSSLVTLLARYATTIASHSAPTPVPTPIEHELASRPPTWHDVGSLAHSHVTHWLFTTLQHASLVLHVMEHDLAQGDAAWYSAPCITFCVSRFRLLTPRHTKPNPPSTQAPQTISFLRFCCGVIISYTPNKAYLFSATHLHPFPYTKGKAQHPRS